MKVPAAAFAKSDDEGNSGSSDQQGSSNDQQASNDDQQQKICDPINGNPFAKECGGKWETHPGPSGGTVICKSQKVYPGLGGTGCVHISP